ncbi:MAG: class I SAM-dependent methyltransferase [Rhodospirillaceae bacterium]|nr:class I SAM-dependent methyltransferase [Rhodospirillaceae bacterium]
MPSFDRPTDAAIAPSAWVLRFAALIAPDGLVLDVAAGHGRHTRALAHLGFRVLAVDVDVAGLGDLRGDPHVDIARVDLETGAWPFADRTFAGIVVTNYLHRAHFPHYVRALDPEGVLIMETFAQGNERLGRPRNPDFLLAPDELFDAFKSTLRVVAYECGAEHEPRPAVRQRICAVKTIEPVLLP